MRHRSPPTPEGMPGGYDAVLLVSFGGPECPDDVLPFLRNVTQGRGVPDDRLAEVTEHYLHFGGVSPINAQCRELLAALRERFAADGPDLPLYWGNRNWHPLLADTVARMRDDGIQRALAFVTSPFGSYSSCRQYQEDIAAAREAVGTGAPVIDKIRHYHDHPGYVGPHADAVAKALAQLPERHDADVRLVFTAHSIPTSMAQASGAGTAGVGGRYEAQLREVAELVAGGVPWDLVWQSRSGSPHVPWLEPDINEHLRTLAQAGATGVVVSPIGFVSDHLEVVWDLDTEAAGTAATLGLDFVRAATPGTDARFVVMIRELVLERIEPDRPRAALGALPTWDFCHGDCCPGGRPRPAAKGCKLLPSKNNMGLAAPPVGE